MNESNIKLGVVIIVTVILVWCIPIVAAENTVNQTNATEPYYITIDPIGNVTQGDVFIIHGTTNLPSTEVLKGGIITIYHETSHDPYLKVPSCLLPNISIRSTSSGINLWSENITDCWSDLPIDWSPYTLYIEYNVNVDAYQEFIILSPLSVTRTSFPATTALHQTSVQTSLVSSSTPTQSSPVPFVLPIAAISMLVVIRFLFGEKGD